jgi:hypothetical protein
MFSESNSYHLKMRPYFLFENFLVQSENNTFYLLVEMSTSSDSVCNLSSQSRMEPNRCDQL